MTTSWLRRWLIFLSVFCLLAFGGISEAATAKSKGGSPKGSAKKAAAAEDLIDPLRHDVMILSPKTFDTGIQKYRDRFPAGVLYYKKSDATREFINDVWDNVAKQLHGMARIGAVDCGEHGVFCKSQGVELTSEDFAVRIYPPMPMAPRMHEGEKSSSKLISSLSRLIPEANINTVHTVEEMQAFVGKNPSIPKVLLFTEKKKPSPMYNALAHTFADRASFALVSGELKHPLHSKFHVKKLPALIIKKGDLTVSARNAEQYRGELRFRPVHDWINVHSETFVKGGGFSSDREPTDVDMTNLRPWLTQRVPELTKASHQDICFKKAQGLCVVYLTDKEELSVEEQQILEDLSDKFTREVKPGFHWMWMRINREVNFAKLLKFTEDAELPRKLPSLVIINPHNRIRFSQLPADQVADQKTMDTFVERIISGDGRFTMIKGNKIPAFISRGAVTPKEKDTEKNEEL